MRCAEYLRENIPPLSEAAMVPAHRPPVPSADNGLLEKMEGGECGSGEEKVWQR